MPHALQWAVRNSLSTSNSSSSTSAAHISGSSLVLFDTAQLRRAAASANSDGSLSNSMYCTPSALARTFFMLIREVSFLKSFFQITNLHFQISTLPSLLLCTRRPKPLNQIYVIMLNDSLKYLYFRAQFCVLLLDNYHLKLL